MRNVDVTEATAALADYAKALRDETLVITENGKPLAWSTRYGIARSRSAGAQLDSNVAYLLCWG